MFRFVIVAAILSCITPIRAETIDLGYRLTMGTYTVPVKIGDLPERSLTLDTGASYTVLRIEDVQNLDLKPRSRAGVTFPHQGVRVEAYFYMIPEMKIGDCVIRNSFVIGIDLPEGRPGAIGMADLEKLSPFTFKSNGQLEITCPK